MTTIQTTIKSKQKYEKYQTLYYTKATLFLCTGLKPFSVGIPARTSVHFICCSELQCIVLSTKSVSGLNIFGGLLEIQFTTGAPDNQD